MGNKPRRQIQMVSKRKMEFIERLEDQKDERKKVLAFNGIIDRAAGVR